MAKQTLSASQFIDDKLRLYSAHSNVRGIPFIGDGFKQSHRKAVDGMMRRGENADKDTVERIAAAAASVTDYHHGVSSLEGTIVGMAQSFAGSNNLPLFEAHGQFGNRLNRKPSASRYIKTKLSPIFRQLFRKDDDLIFERIDSNGLKVEPKYFTPILPLVLINGAEGMGTGHSCYILSYNPEDIRTAIVKILDGKTIKPNSLTPWWRGFDGTVTRDLASGQVVIEGKYHVKPGRTPTIVVTELPIGMQSDQYKQHLQKLEDREIVLDHDNLSDKKGFEFVVRVPRSTQALPDAEIKKLFKLVSRESENLTVWNGDGVLTRYENVEALLLDFVIWRLERYEDRRQALIKKVQADIAWAGLKIRFIRFYLANYKFFRDTPNKELQARLVAEGFERHDELLGMPMRNLTHDKIAELEKDVEDLKLQLTGLQADDAASMYRRELKELKLP
jgi:DNA topoisomerase-2